jgi:hypothetical protein
VSRRVFCDVCDRDYTFSLATGGFKCGPHYYCPECAAAYEKVIDERLPRWYEITARCAAGQRFANFVRQGRGR